MTGRRVLVTRQAPELVERLVAQGIDVVEIPAIAIEPPADARPLRRAIDAIDEYDWVVFTSANAVRAVAEALRAAGRVPLPPRLRVGSVGRATTAAIGEAWPARRVDLEPAGTFHAAALVEAFAGGDIAGRRVLLPVSDRAADTVRQGLETRGARVERVVAYRTIAAPGVTERMRAELARGVDLVVFASPSAVDVLLAMAPESAAGVPAVVIGPTTAEAARGAGLTVLAEAHPSTFEGLADAVRRVLETLRTREAAKSP